MQEDHLWLAPDPGLWEQGEGGEGLREPLARQAPELLLLWKITKNTQRGPTATVGGGLQGPLGRPSTRQEGWDPRTRSAWAWSQASPPPTFFFQTKAIFLP